MSPRRCSPTTRRRGAASVVAAMAALALASLSSLSSTAHADATTSVEDTFGIATFNILGSQHTKHSKEFQPGTVRARTTAAMIVHRDLDLIGMQEVQSDQLSVLTNLLPSYTIWPAASLGHNGIRLQIAFSNAKFQLVKDGSVMAPFDRQTVPIPWVLLRDIASGRQFYVVTIHNSPRHLQKERDQATAIEVQLVQQLRATGHGVFLMGDANEKANFFCHVVGQTDLEAANGGTATSLTDCQPPRGYEPIDWILGKGPFAMSDYTIYDDKYVQSASDHHLIRAVVTMRAKPAPAS